MDYYQWSHEKNARLKEERGISFERIVMHIDQGAVLDVYKHPNVEKYSNQQILVVEIDGYAWLVPFVESDVGRFLKTAMPSRKATRTYLGDGNEKI